MLIALTKIIAVFICAFEEGNNQLVIHKNKSLGNIEYERVNAIIYTEKDGKIKVSAELMDKCGHSVCRVRPNEIRFKEDK